MEETLETLDTLDTQNDYTKKEKEDNIDMLDTNYYDDMIKCRNCGNMWDGYAQCTCYQLECYSTDNSDSSDHYPEQVQEHNELLENSEIENSEIENSKIEHSEIENKNI